MSSLEAFQGEHGGRWATLIQSPEFNAAMTLVNSEKIQAIASLTDDEIAERGTIILADLRGHLQHENALVGLSELKKLVFQDLGEPTYPSPEEEARAEAQAGPENTASTAGPASTLIFNPEEERARQEQRKPRRHKRRKKSK